MNLIIHTPQVPGEVIGEGGGEGAVGDQAHQETRRRDGHSSKVSYLYTMNWLTVSKKNLIGLICRQSHFPYGVHCSLISGF